MIRYAATQSNGRTQIGLVLSEGNIRRFVTEDDSYIPTPLDQFGIADVDVVIGFTRDMAGFTKALRDSGAINEDTTVKGEDQLEPEPAPTDMPFGKEWESYLELVVPKDASTHQVIETRRAFYAGARCLLTLIARNAAGSGGEITRADEELMARVEAELHHFARHVGTTY